MNPPVDGCDYRAPFSPLKSRRRANTATGRSSLAAAFLRAAYSDSVIEIRKRLSLDFALAALLREVALPARFLNAILDYLPISIKATAISGYPTRLHPREMATCAFQGQAPPHGEHFTLRKLGSS